MLNRLYAKFDSVSDELGVFKVGCQPMNLIVILCARARIGVWLNSTF